MGFEAGGHADKLGNRYEGRWVVRQLLLVLGGQLRSVTIEAIGDDEEGVDLWIERNNGVREAQQCKSKNGSKNSWSIADLKKRSVLHASKVHLNRDKQWRFALISSVTCEPLQSIATSARDSSGDAEEYYLHQILETGRARQKAFSNYCHAIGLSAEVPEERAIAFDYLRRTEIHTFVDDQNGRDDLEMRARFLVAGEPSIVIALLAAFAEERLRHNITAPQLESYLLTHGLLLRRLVADDRVFLQLSLRNQEFSESIQPRLAAGKLIRRPEADQILQILQSEDPPAVILLHGPAGNGKSGVLFQCSQQLGENGTTYLALRLDRKIPTGSTRQFGESLGLPDSPTICLSDVAGSRQAVLILDQLDALRWTSTHSAAGLDVCQTLMSEVKALRSMGHRLTLILSCRTFDLDHDPHIQQWLKAPEPRRYSKIEVQLLPEEQVKRVAKDKGVDPERLIPKRLTLLSNVQNLAMWCEIVNSDRRSPEFDSATGLMRAFWKSRRQLIESVGISAEQRDSLFDRIVTYMELKATLSAPSRFIEGNERLATELQTLGLIHVSGSTLTFGHQSYLDFLIADKVTRNLTEMSLMAWLGPRESQSLFRREQLRQALFLIADELSDDLTRIVQQQLDGQNVRFHIKQLVLEALSQITPTNSILALIQERLNDPYWRDFFLQHVLWKSPSLVAALTESGLLGKWLDSGDDRLVNQAMWLLGSVNESRGELIATVLQEYVSRGIDWAKMIIFALPHNMVATESERIFKLRLKCIRQRATDIYIPWKTIATKSPQRALRLLNALLSQYADGSREGFEHGAPLRSTNSDDYKEIVRAAQSEPEMAWKLLLKQHLHHQSLRRTRRKRFQSNNGENWDASEPLLDVGPLPRIVFGALRAAGRQLAETRPLDFLRKSERLSKVSGRFIRHLLTASYARLPIAFSDQAIGWLLGDYRRMNCGPGRRRPRWWPVAKLIEKHSGSCSMSVFRALENTLLSYRDPEERRFAAGWLHESGHGVFRNRFGLGQHFLLPALDADRRSAETTGRIGVLQRKFIQYPISDFVAPRSLGGWVRSPLNPEKIGEISDKAWIKMLTNPSIVRRGGLWNRSKFLPGCVIESSIDQFSADFSRAVSVEPDRFARLAIEIPTNAPSDYLADILRGLSLTSPSSEVPENRRESWIPANAESVTEVLELPHVGVDADQARAYCHVLASRDDVSITPKMLAKVTALSQHDSPAKSEFHGSKEETLETCPSHRLEHIAINCVRGLSARAIGRVLEENLDRLPLLITSIRRLVTDQHPAVRLAAIESCYPIWRIDRRLALELVMAAIEGDLRVACSRPFLQLANFLFPEFTSEVEPVFKQMIASENDEIATTGACQITARWIFHGVFGDEVISCLSGKISQRKGVAQTAASLIHDEKWFSRSYELVSQLWNDSEKEIRESICHHLKFHEILKLPCGGQLLKAFTLSAAFEDDPAHLLYALDQYVGRLADYSEVIFAICSEFSATMIVDSRDPSKRMAHMAHKLSPLLLRLYEQAESAGENEIRQKCLDAWDAMLEARVGANWSLSRDLG